MKIYTIWFGEYSDAYIDRVTTSKEKAEEFCRLYNTYPEWYDGYETPYIEEYEVDDWELEFDDDFDRTVGYKFKFNFESGKLFWYTKNGAECYRIENKVEKRVGNRIHVTIWCKENNFEKAQKIAQDEYMKWKYEHIDEL